MAGEEVVAQVERALADLADEHRDDPEGHMTALYLLGLEREQIVAVSYDEATMARRLARLDVDEDVRRLLHHALLWIWKEEQMHAIFIRGALMGPAPWWRRVVVWSQQLTGALGGWASAVLQHARWRDAPLSRFWATIFTWMGALMGKVPRPVLAQLRLGSFGDYCRFSIGAERSASMTWRRIHDLAVAEGGAPQLAEGFARMAADEARHTEVFELFAEAFDDDDRLRPGWDAARLADRLRTIGESFLPRELRADAADNPLGSGGAVHVRCDDARCGGAHPVGVDKRAALRELLDASDLAGVVRERAGDKPLSECLVAIKPSWMLGYSRRDLATITDPELVRELCRYLRELGCGDVALLEGRNLYDWYFEGRSVDAVASYFGFDFEEARVVDCTEDMTPHRYRRGMAHYAVPATWQQADVRISFGKLRSHPVEQVYLSLCHLEGLSARSDEFVFVDRQAHIGQAVNTMLADFPPHFALLDAYDHAPDGLLGMLACPRPCRPRRLYAGRDAVSVDAVAARHVGEHDVDVSGYLRNAVDWFGDPSATLDVHGCDEPIAGWRNPCQNELTATLSFLSYPVYIALSGRGALFVPEMDTDAFPPKGRVSWPLGAARRFIRWLLNMKAPPG